jgi:GDPmannose 4,6-dehydratase
VLLLFKQPVETIQSMLIETLDLVETCGLFDKKKLLNKAGSIECTDDTLSVPAHEQTPFQPHRLYAVAKASVFWLEDNCRETYGLFACTGIFSTISHRRAPSAS